MEPYFTKHKVEKDLEHYKNSPSLFFTKIMIDLPLSSGEKVKSKGSIFDELFYFYKDCVELNGINFEQFVLELRDAEVRDGYSMITEWSKCSKHNRYWKIHESIVTTESFFQMNLSLEKAKKKKEEEKENNKEKKEKQKEAESTDWGLYSIKFKSALGKKTYYLFCPDLSYVESWAKNSIQWQEIESIKEVKNLRITEAAHQAKSSDINLYGETDGDHAPKPHNFKNFILCVGMGDIENSSVKSFDLGLTPVDDFYVLKDIEELIDPKEMFKKQ